MQRPKDLLELRGSFDARSAGTRLRMTAASEKNCHKPDEYEMTFRVMGPHEQGRFAPEAWGRLLQLKGSGALSAPELEQIIERALTHIDGRIALDDLRLLLEGSGLIDDTDGPGPDRVH